MEKWEDEIKKHANPNPPDEITNRINATLQKLPPKRRPRRKLYYTVAASAFAFLITITATLFSPAVADTMRSIPILGSVFETVGSIGVQRGNEQGLTTLLGKQVEVEGHRITFTESLYDGSEVHIGYLIESLDPTNTTAHYPFPSDLILTIDGRRTGYGLGGTGQLLENGNYAGTISLRFQDEIPDNFLLGISPREGRSWEVELPVELQGLHETFLVNETREIEDMTIHYDTITFYPTATEIAFRQITDIPTIEEDRLLRLSYMAVDNEGRVLQPFGGGGGGSPQGEKFVQSYNYNFEPLEKVPESITIKPYLRRMEEAPPTSVRGKWEGQELRLSQGEIGIITILSVDEVDGVYTVIYEVEGEDLYEQSILLFLRDSSGTIYDYDNRPPNRVEGTINRYKAVFSPGEKIDDLYFITFEKEAPNFVKELEVTIEFKE